MVITIVIDDFSTLTNGTVMSAYRFVDEFKKRGHTVRVCAINVKGTNMYSLEERFIPIVSKLAIKQDTHFAVADEKTIEEAIKGSDVVHMYLPWKLAQVCCKIANKLGIACTAGFHVLPENLTHNAGVVRAIPFINNIIYSTFKHKLYKYVDNIHVPTKLIADMIRRHGYQAKLHIISNGVCDDFKPVFDEKGFVEKPKTENGKIRILAIGRYAVEKRQDVLIKAIANSKYKDNIELVLAGRGPNEKKLRELVKKYNVNTVFGFYNKEELIDVIRSSTLYVHSADIEVEAISCIEAFACGKVIIVNSSNKTATTQFAIDERSLYKKNDYKDLAKKIDYFLDNEQIRRELELKYANLANYYRIENSIVKTEEMFKQAISDNKIKLALQNKQVTKGSKKIKKTANNKNIFFGFFSNLLYYLVALPVLCIFNKIAYGAKVKGKKNLKGLKYTGAVTICNHVHEMDGTFVAMAISPSRTLYTSLPQNLKRPIAGFFVRAFGGVPVPTTMQENSVFFYCLSKRLNAGKYVHFYPEGQLTRYREELLPFKKGAFHLAVTANAPVVPMRIIYRPRKLAKNAKPRMTLVIGKPIYPDFTLIKKEAVAKLAEDSKNAMEELGNFSKK